MQTRHLRFIRRNLIRSVLILLLISLVYVLQQGSVKASPLVDWTADGQPIINSSYSTEAGNYITNQPGCTYQKIAIRSKYAGIIGTSQINGCVVKGEHLSLAHTSDGMYVSFGSDSYFYKFHTDNTGIMVFNTVLVPNADRIGFVMSVPNQNGIEVYDDFSSRLTLDPNTLSYRMTNWGNRLFPTDDHPLNAVSINFSNNGRFAVYQNARDWPGATPGLVRVDLETGEKKQFGIMWYANYASAIPGPHYTISNDGTTVIGGGIGILSVWALSDACVKEPYNPSNRAQNDCPTRVFGDVSYGEAFDSQTLSRTYGLELSDDASELSFLYQSPNGGTLKRINLSPSGYVSQAPQLEYLALGDSYSSGEGDTERDKRTNEKHYRPFTDVEESITDNQPREKCHISTRSYPYVLAQGMGLGSPQNNSSTRWQTVACSGATTFDIDNENKDEYKGQGKGGEEEGKPRLEGYDVSDKKAIALNEFIPGRHEQIDFVSAYKPKVITLTMGGNDVGFSKRLTGCFFSVYTCRLAEDAGKAELAKSIRDQYGNLVSLYKELYKASGDQSRIYVLGYPKFISSNLSGYCGLNTGFLDIREREVAEFGIEYMNNVIEQAAKSAGVKYIDIEDSLQNGRLCEKGQSYMTGASVIGSGEKQESFHPNVKGNYQIAMAVWEQVNHESLLDYDICPNTTENRCPDDTSTKESIIIPPYFQITEPGYEIKYVSDMTYGTVAKGDFLQATRSSYSFSPGSTVEVTLFSEPMSLGSFMVSDSGSLEADLQVPYAVPAGYHTLVVDGVTYSGEPIRYEQVILVEGANPGDIDDNGVLDSEELCGPFITISGVDSDLDGIDDACDPQITEKPELYRWRWGYTGRTYNQNPEDENQIYVERNIWAGSATGVSGDYDSDNDSWAVVGVSSTNQLSDVNTNSVENSIDFEVLGEGTSSSPYYPIVYIHPGSETCKAYQPISLSRVLANESRTLTVANLSNEKCPQQLPETGSPEEPGPGPPKNAGLLLWMSNTLKAVKSKLSNFLHSTIAIVMLGLQVLRIVFSSAFNILGSLGGI